MTGGRPASPGWTDVQKAEHGRLFALVQELAAAVVVHEYWVTLPKDDTVVAARSALGQHPDVQVTDVPDAVAA
jgi:imidazoleglycerol phosphate synthase glutamine amidotransferase subunit HisH